MTNRDHAQGFGGGSGVSLQGGQSAPLCVASQRLYDRKSLQSIEKDKEMELDKLVAEIATLRGRVAELEDIQQSVAIMERALRESEELLKVFSEAPLEAIFLSDKGVCIGQNLAAQKIFGYSNDESRGRSGTEWIAPECRDLVSQKMLSGYEEPYVAVGLRKDGTTFPCEIHGKMLDYQGRLIRVTTLRDITERKLAEEALRASEEKYRDLVESINDVIFEIDGRGILTYISPIVRNMLGCEPESLIGKTFAGFVHPDDRVLFKQEIF